MEPHFLPSGRDFTVRGGPQARLHERAAQSARECFGNRVFIRGVVEISNYCRENCQYCGMRRTNRDLSRYRARYEELAAYLLEQRPRDITDINLQAGEDPVAVREVALPLIRTLRRHSNLGISVCLGTLDAALYEALREAGASIYILKFEMADQGRYSELQAPGTLEERMAHLSWLSEQGWHVSSGFIAGLPDQGIEDLRNNCRLAGSLPLAGCSVSPFIPGESTPWAKAPPADLEVTLNCMAILRLMRPDWIIPAVSALNLCDPERGYRRGLRTGANLVTINLTPSKYRGDYLLYRRDRIIMDEERILSALNREGLRPSTLGLADYYRGQSPLAPVPQPNSRDELQ